MNLQQKLQIGLGALLVLAGGVSCFFFPPAAGALFAGGVAVAGFSNTVTKAVANTLKQ